MEIDLCEWLGTASVAEFTSEEQIRNYFSERNLRYMFGNDADISQRDEAMKQCIDAYKQEKRR